MARQMFPFGSGRLFLKPSRTPGVATASTGPLDYTRFGVAALQEGGFGIEVDVKELYGANRFPVDVRTGMGKVDGSAKFADWDPDAMGIALDMAVTAGVNRMIVNEPLVLSASSPHPADTVVNSSGFVKNLEVITSAGDRMVQVATLSAVVAGGTVTPSYTVSASGQYKFHTSKASATVYASYVYSSSSGKKVVLANTEIGVTTVCAGIFQGRHDAQEMVLELDQVVPFGLKTASRIDDWMFLDMGLKAFADPNTGVIGRINVLS